MELILVEDPSPVPVTRICRSDLIVVDDIGLLPAGQDAVEASYRVADAGYDLTSATLVRKSAARLIAPRGLQVACRCGMLVL